MYIEAMMSETNMPTISPLPWKYTPANTNITSREREKQSREAS